MSSAFSSQHPPDMPSALPLRRVMPLMVLASACASSPPPATQPSTIECGGAENQVSSVLDDWHQAAAAADEERYFAHFHPQGIFLGTDATERWTVEAFRAYAHPHFAKGKAWSFQSLERRISVQNGWAFFDETLQTPNLGPCRGSGVLIRGGSGWKIAQYNLTLTIPNERVDAVRALLK